MSTAFTDLGLEFGKFNPNHVPSGSPEGGEFASGVGGAITAINEKFPVNPNNSAQRVLLVNKEPAVTFEVAERDGRLRIKTMQALQPKSGAGTVVLQRLLKIADAHGVTTELTASPFGPEKERISHEQLQAWYGKHGFKLEAGHDPALGYMVRTPKVAKAMPGLSAVHVNVPLGSVEETEEEKKRKKLQPAISVIKDLDWEFGKYNPDQPRVPAGSPGGGEWATATGGKVAGGKLLAGSGKGQMFQILQDGQPKNLEQLLNAVKISTGVSDAKPHLMVLKNMGQKNGEWDIQIKGNTVTMTQKSPGEKPVGNPNTAAQAAAATQALHNAKPGVDPIDWIVDNKAAIENLNAASNKFMSKLDSKEVEAVKNYTGYGYKSLNSALRSGSHVHDETVVYLTKAIQKGGFPRDVVVYRGLPGNVSKALQPGNIFVDNGFISTSISKETANSFGSNSLARIKVSAGHPVAPIGNHSSHPSEKEVVLPRGSMFRVDKTTQEGSNYIHDLTLL